jgi:chromosome segregation ATPase
MENVVRAVEQLVETTVEARIAEIRDHHLHDTRTSSEVHLEQMNELAATCNKLRSARKRQVQQILVDRKRDQKEMESLKRDHEEQVLNLERDNEELAEELVEVETENAVLEERVSELECDMAAMREELEEEWDASLRQNAGLEVQNVLLKQEVQTWKQRYEKTFAEKVAVEVQYGVSASR